jgi:catalase
LAEDEFALTETGELVLNKILINYFALIELVTLGPVHMIPGIEKRPTMFFR